jgi:tripartite ATP-independent transporter DctM subunit
MSTGIITILLFGSLLLLLTLGFPLAFCFGSVAVIFIIWQWGHHALFILATTAFSSWTSFILIAVPLFILMANLLERSGLADDLYDMMHKWTGPLRGGLAMGTVVICAIFAAMAGISGVATVTMGLIALPSMLRRNYDKIIAVGCIAAGGTLGILIPPSIIMILYASLTGESVGKLFMGGVFPGIILSSIFIAYIGIRSFFQPHLGPAIPREERASWGEKLVSLKAVILPIILIFLVLGVIYTGICTPTEASGIGALGALMVVIIKGRFTWQMFVDALRRTLNLTTMVMWILLGSKCFSHIYIAVGASEFVHELIAGFEVNRWFIVIGMQIVFFILGCFMDPAGIIMICTPVFIPIILELGFDAVWFGVLFTINMEIGYITPPFGFNLFYMKSLAGPMGISMGEIYRSIIPFTLLAFIGIAIIMLFPELALWLPSSMIKR